MPKCFQCFSPPILGWGFPRFVRPANAYVFRVGQSRLKILQSSLKILTLKAFLTTFKMRLVENVPYNCLSLPVDKIRRGLKQIDGISKSLLVKIGLGQHYGNIRASDLLKRSGLQNFYRLRTFVVGQKNVSQVTI